MRWSILFVVPALVIFAGCGDGRPNAKVGAKGDFAKEFAFDKKAAPAQEGANAPEAQGGKGGEAGAKQEKVDQPRKIKYTADLKVIVEDFDKSWQALKVLIKDTKAISEQEDIDSSAGSQRTGTFKLRVPVDQLEKFRDAVINLGNADRNTLTAVDITGEYYDLDAHVKNKQAEREAVRKILQKTGEGDLEQFFRVKRELDSINDYINRQETQLKVWKGLTDLTTVNVQIREKQKYNPDQKPNDRPEPTFGERADKTWTGTWDLFVGFCQWIVLAAIALTPWVPIPIVFLLGLWIAVRLLIRISKKPPAEVVVVEEAPKKKVKKEDQPESKKPAAEVVVVEEAPKPAKS